MYKRKPQTEEHRKKIAIAHKGMKYKPMSEEGKRNISIAHKGTKFSEERKQKMKGRTPWNKGKPSLYMMGKNNYFYGKNLTGKQNGFYGKKHTEETNQINRIAHLGNKTSDEARRKIGEASRRSWLTNDYTERNKKISKALKGREFPERRGENSPGWKGGKSYDPYTPAFNQQLKDRIRVRDNFICQLCGVPELECNQRLSIHHIDYDKNNCKENNLTALCRGCNTKVNSNKNYWTKYFVHKIGATV